MQCEIQPQSEPVICRYNAYDYKKQGRGGGKALPCCSSFPYILLAGSRASPSLSCPQRCSSAPVRGVCCRARTLRRGEQLPMPHVPMHVWYASWPQRNSCTQRHRHTACVNAHTICQRMRLYGREYVGATAIHAAEHARTKMSGICSHPLSERDSCAGCTYHHSTFPKLRRLRLD